MAELRPLNRDDAPQVLDAFLTDPQMARQGDVTDLATAATYIHRVTDAASGGMGFAVDVDGAAVGWVGLSVDSGNLLGWFFYWLHRDHRGVGLMAAAARTVADWALAPSERGGAGLHRLELGHRRNNPSSRAVAAAAGFVQEGVEREKFLVHGTRVDVLTWGRLRDDPVPEGDRLMINMRET